MDRIYTWKWPFALQVSMACNSLLRHTPHTKLSHGICSWLFKSIFSFLTVCGMYPTAHEMKILGWTETEKSRQPLLSAPEWWTLQKHVYWWYTCAVRMRLHTYEMAQNEMAQSKFSIFKPSKTLAGKGTACSSKAKNSFYEQSSHY